MVAPHKVEEGPGNWKPMAWRGKLQSKSGKPANPLPTQSLVRQSPKTEKGETFDWESGS